MHTDVTLTAGGLVNMGAGILKFPLRVDFACAKIRTVATELKYLCCSYKNKIERYRLRRCR